MAMRARDTKLGSRWASGYQGDPSVSRISVVLQVVDSAGTQSPDSGNF